MGRLILSSKGLAWHKKGHPWIFRDDLERIEDAGPGEIVALETRGGQFLAQGFFSERSKIAFRLITRSRESLGREFWRERILTALTYRRLVTTESNAYRVVFGESDGIPSLIVDRYADHLVLQTLARGAENLLPLFTELLVEIVRPSSLILRNDLAVRDLEGLPREKKVLFGERPPEVGVFEGDVRYLVNLWTGQKTGAYLDQRENRQVAGRLLRGKVLDGFCYQGLFALHASKGASEVLGIDSSLEAVEQARRNAEWSGAKGIEFRKENVFDFLKGEAGRGARYDGIILDPPAFAKSRGEVSGASRGYKELNLRAIRLLNPGGILVTASCSYNLSEGRFLDILRECAGESGAALRIIERRGQSADHPVLLAFPESFYLKCLFLEKMTEDRRP